MFVIESNTGIVSGFLRKHQIVQVTDSPEYFKKFKTENAATKWAEKYANAGYGLGSFTVKSIKEV
jgi:hypothetical protein